MAKIISHNAGTDFCDLKDTECHVYIIKPTKRLKPCKIGIARDLRKRLSCLQVGHWLPLHIFQYFRFDSVEFAFAVEQASHRSLSDAGKRLKGEWFNVTGEEACLVVRAASQSSSVLELQMADDPYDEDLFQYEMVADDDDLS